MAHHQNSDGLSELTRFGVNPGALRGWLYLPDLLARKTPLVVVLHGCTQTAAGYGRGSGWIQLAENKGFALLFPEQQRSNNATYASTGSNRETSSAMPAKPNRSRK